MIFSKDSLDPDIIILPGIDYSGHFLDPQLEAVKVIVSQGQPLPTDDTNSTPENETGEKGDVNNIPIECIDSAVRDKYGAINYELPLTTNMKVRSLTLDTRWAHKLVDMNTLNANYKNQGGFVKVEEIVCNLKSLSLNIIEPLLKEYPGFLPINSAFRATTSAGGKSQHMVGEAIDIQWPGISTEKYMEIANWVLKNLPVDQIIYEHTDAVTNTIWLHISHRKDGVQRGQAQTMKDGIYTAGFKNYYPKIFSLLKNLLSPGGNGLRNVGVFSAVKKVISNAIRIPSVMPIALVVLSINFKLLLNCLTNLFFRLINLVNSACVGQEDCSSILGN